MVAARTDLLARVAELIPERADQAVLVGIDGVDGSGKTMFADQLAAVLGSSGARAPVRVSLDDFHHPRVRRYRRGRDSPEGCYLDSFDYPRFVADVLEPVVAEGRYRLASHDLSTDRLLDPEWLTAPVGAVVIVDGLFLQRPELARRWDLVVFLDVPFEVTAGRMAERDGPPSRGNDRYVGASRIYFAEVDPHAHADVLIDNTDLQHPRIVRAAHGRA